MQKHAELAELIREHQAGIWRYLRCLGCEANEADDLTQATFLAVLRRPDTLDKISSLPAYLRIVARNLFRQSLRHPSRSFEAIEADAAEKLWAEISDENHWHHYLGILRQCLEELRGRVHEAIHLRYKEGRSRREVSVAMGIGEEAVKSLLRRGKEALKQCAEKKTADE